jgi:hypothetical protein
VRLDIRHHTQRPWRVHDLLPDFIVDEVRAYPITADPAAGEDFAMFCAMAGQGDAAPKGAAGLLLAFRVLLGRIFGWDREDRVLPIPGCTETSLRQRLPGAERDQVEEGADPFGFSLVYQADSERLLELSNSTVHAALHIGWVEHDDGSAGAEMAVYWKPRGWFGRLYMAVISPFRFFVVYPALMRKVAAEWDRFRDTRAADLGSAPGPSF